MCVCIIRWLIDFIHTSRDRWLDAKPRKSQLTRNVASHLDPSKLVYLEILTEIMENVIWRWLSGAAYRLYLGQKKEQSFLVAEKAALCSPFNLNRRCVISSFV